MKTGSTWLSRPTPRILPSLLLLIATQCGYDSDGAADVPMVTDVVMGHEDVCGCCQYSPHNTIYDWRCVARSSSINTIYFIDMTDGRCCINFQANSETLESASCYVAPGESVELGITDDGTPMIRFTSSNRECTPYDDD